MSRKKITGQTSVDWLPFGSLAIDERVQRQLIPARLRYLAQNFAMEMVGTVTVSRRSDGRYYVIDGQHRVLAALEKGFGDTKVRCVVLQGQGLADEGRAFLALNDSRPVSAIDKFTVGLTAGEPDVIGVDAILREHGLNVSRFKRDGGVTCPDRLLKIYRRDPELLREVIRTATTAWGTRSAATEQIVLAGLAQVLGRFNGEMDRGVLVDRLGKYRGGPSALLGDARGFADIRPISVTRACAELIVDAYNKKRQNRLAL